MQRPKVSTLYEATIAMAARRPPRLFIRPNDSLEGSTPVSFALIADNRSLNVMYSLASSAAFSDLKRWT
jgi:hypothetical protein